MSEGLEVRVSEDSSGGSNKLIAAINNTAAAADKLAVSEGKALAASKELGNGASAAASKVGAIDRAFASAQRVGAGFVSGLNALRSAAAATAQAIGTQLGRAADTAAAGFSRVQGALGRFQAGASGLTGVLGGIASALSVGKLIEAADTYTGIENKVRLLTKSQGELNTKMAEIQGIANRTGQSIEATGNLYAKLGASYMSAGKDAGLAGPLVEKINRAVSITGPSAETAKNGLMQFAQGLSAGAVRGDEFNSVVENTPGLAQAIAAGFSAAGPITVGALRAIAEQGGLTFDKIEEALNRSGPAFAVLADAATKSVGSAFTVLNNNFIAYVGQANNATGATGLLRNAILLVANNLNIVIPVLGGFIALLALGAIAGAIQSIAALAVGFVGLAGAIATATAAMLTNPLVLGTLAVALIAGTAAFSAFGLTVGGVFNSVTSFLGGLIGFIPGLGGAGGAATAAALQFDGFGNAITGAGTKAAAASTNGLTPLQNSINGISGITVPAKAGIDGIGTSVTTLATKAPAAGTAVGSLKDQINAVSGVAPKAAKGVENLGKETSGAVKPTDNLSDKAKAVAKAMADITPTSNAAAGAVKAGGAAASAAANDVSRLSAAYNQLGEKLETFEEWQTRATEALTRTNTASADALNNLQQYGSTVSAAVNANGQLAVSFGSLASQANSAASAVSNASNSNQSYQGGPGAGNMRTGGNDNSGGDSGGGRTAVTRDDFNIGNAGDGRSQVNRDPVITGEFGGGGYPWTFGGIEVRPAVGFSEVNGERRAFAELQQWEAFLALNGDVFPTSGRGFNPQLVLSYARSGGRVDPYDYDVKAGIPIGQRRESDDGRRGGTNERAARSNFAHGGRITGMGGTDSVPFNAMVSPGERITVETPAQMRNNDRGEHGGDTNNVTNAYNELTVIIKADDYDSFRRNEKQITQDLAARLRRFG